MQYRKLDITMKLCGMIQVVSVSTRILCRQSMRTECTIDVAMTNCCAYFVESKVLADRMRDLQTV